MLAASTAGYNMSHASDRRLPFLFDEVIILTTGYWQFPCNQEGSHLTATLSTVFMAAGITHKRNCAELNPGRSSQATAVLMCLQALFVIVYSTMVSKPELGLLCQKACELGA